MPSSYFLEVLFSPSLKNIYIYIYFSYLWLQFLLIVRISVLEKDRNTPLYSRRSEFRKDYCELEEVDLKGTNERKSESK